MPLVSRRRMMCTKTGSCPADVSVTRRPLFLSRKADGAKKKSTPPGIKSLWTLYKVKRIKWCGDSLLWYLPVGVTSTSGNIPKASIFNSQWECFESLSSCRGLTLPAATFVGLPTVGPCSGSRCLLYGVPLVPTVLLRFPLQ